ncbi:glycoside hydrolase family 105 protein [Neobacillus niacini]|uniref:glycoside hydrolase family 88/105 protein n=1 Tax=Neobacillus niacini TaxID=86668 RepID=UPI0021CB0593|nr:glycoside hydrolase family 105 protein [Neobacillus niacini]MCM3764166.1 glycoside hydrolase family 105 protein [Neobacillus niacini]
MQTKQMTTETPLRMAEKACQALMRTFRPEELPPVGEFHYHQGVFLFGMYRVYQATGKEEYFNYIKAYYDHLIDEYGNVRFERDQLDSTMTGILLFPLYEKTKDPRYMIAAKRLRSALDTINRTSENGFWHKEKYPYQMWLDGLFMGGPFMLLYSQQFHEEELIQMVLLQEKLMRKHMTDEKTGLLYHAWDEKRVQPWASPETGCSPEFWGRSVGWYGTALIDLLEILGERKRGQEELIQALQNFIPAIVKFQDDQTGLWYQIVDKGELADNWLESSCSALFIYFISKAIQHGYVDETYRAVVEKAYKGLLEHMVEEYEETADLKGICIGTSAGVYDYYVSRPTSKNDLHGMGAFLLGSMAYYDLINKV